MSNTQQYLVQCEQDQSFCVIYKRSIIYDEKIKRLNKGVTISWWWPENGKRPKKYQGQIIEISSKFKKYFFYLLLLLEYFFFVCIAT